MAGARGSTRASTSTDHSPPRSSNATAAAGARSTRLDPSSTTAGPVPPATATRPDGASMATEARGPTSTSVPVARTSSDGPNHTMSTTVRVGSPSAPVTAVARTAPCGPAPQVSNVPGTVAWSPRRGRCASTGASSRCRSGPASCWRCATVASSSDRAGERSGARLVEGDQVVVGALRRDVDDLELGLAQRVGGCSQDGDGPAVGGRGGHEQGLVESGVGERPGRDQAVARRDEELDGAIGPRGGEHDAGDRRGAAPAPGPARPVPRSPNRRRPRDRPGRRSARPPTTGHGPQATASPVGRSRLPVRGAVGVDGPQCTGSPRRNTTAPCTVVEPEREGRAGRVGPSTAGRPGRSEAGIVGSVRSSAWAWVITARATTREHQGHDRTEPPTDRPRGRAEPVTGRLGHGSDRAEVGVAVRVRRAGDVERGMELDLGAAVVRPDALPVGLADPVTAGAVVVGRTPRVASPLM